MRKFDICSQSSEVFFQLERQTKIHITELARYVLLLTQGKEWREFKYFYIGRFRFSRCVTLELVAACRSTRLVMHCLVYLNTGLWG